jgi:hypothetical protein
MYLSNLDIIAICIALVAQMTMSFVLFISARNWRKKYLDAVRLLKQERSARAYWQEHKETVQ